MCKDHNKHQKQKHSPKQHKVDLDRLKWYFDSKQAHWSHKINDTYNTETIK
jgi:hypothetical protein